MGEGSNSDCSSSDIVNKDGGQQSRPSFSMAATLAMVRKRQEDQRLKAQENEKVEIESRKELARAKRRRRRQNQRKARANAKAEAAVESKAVSDSASEPNDQIDEDGLINLNRSRETSPTHSTGMSCQPCIIQGSSNKLPLKKRIKARVELENPLDLGLQKTPIEETNKQEKSINKQLSFKLIPRAILVKRPKGDG